MAIAATTTVVQAASSRNLVDLATVKLELNISDSSQDAYLGSVIARLSEIAHDYCGRPLLAETLRDDFRFALDVSPAHLPHRAGAVQLSRWPVASIASVVEDGTTLTAGTDYSADLRSGELIRLGADGFHCVWSFKALAVTYVGGFSTVPASIQDAMVRAVKARWYARDRDPSLRSEEVPGVLRQTWSAADNQKGGLPDDVLSILDDYRVPVIA